MRVVLAKSAGFCFGVRRAVDTVYEKLSCGEPIYTYGPIIHNEEVVDDLARRGVEVVGSVGELEGRERGTVVIRAHGAERGVAEAIEALGFSVEDAACPFVKKIHRIVERYSAEGCQVVIVGDGSHPEVRGIKSWAVGQPAAVVSTPGEAESFEPEPLRKVCVVSQTTFQQGKFQEIVDIIAKKAYDIIVLNTICNATEERQAEARDIARRVDAMIVIGGRNSSNTQKLFKICQKECNNTYYIQTSKDLNMSLLRSVDSVGITAGASTPKKIIEEVQKLCQK